MGEKNLVISKTASLIGTQFFYTFVSLWVASNFSNTSMLALSLSLTSVITLIFTLFGGATSRSPNIVKILLKIDILSAFLCVFMAVISISNENKIFVFMVLTILNSLLSINTSFSGPIFKKLTGLIVPNQDILKYNEILSASKELVKFIMPMLTSLLYSIGVVSAFVALFINGISFLISYVSLSGIPKSNIVYQINQQNKVNNNYLKAAKLVFQNKSHFEKFQNIFLLYIFVAGLNILLPFYTVRIIKSPLIYGFIESGQAFGAIIASVTFKIFKVDISLRKERLGIALASVIILLEPLIKNVALLGIGMLVLSFFYVRYNVGFQSYLQVNIDNESLGYVYSIYYTLTAISALIGNTFTGMISSNDISMTLSFIGLSMIVINLNVVRKLIRNIW